MKKEELKELACSLWVESATALRNFKPMSYDSLKSELEALGEKVGTSTLQRWCKEEGWEQKLKNKTLHTLSGEHLPIISMEDINIVKNTRDLSNKSIAILQNFVDQIQHKIKLGGIVTIDETKAVVGILAVSSKVHLDSYDLEEKEGEKNKIKRSSIVDRLNTIDAEIEE